MTENKSFWDTRNEMEMELYGKIQAHPQKGSWQEDFAATSLMLNSAGHPDGTSALKLVVEDTVQAYERKAPVDIVRFALRLVCDFRKMLLEQQPGRQYGLVSGEITLEILKNELKDKLPENYFNEIFIN